MDNDPRAGAVTARLLTFRAQGSLVICGTVYAELHANPRANRAVIDSFLTGTGIRLDPQMGLDAWAEAGRANADYHARRRAGGAAGVRPVLPDFLIGAHAQHHAHRLFTLNPADFADFPQLRVLTL